MIAVQSKATAASITLNSKDVITTIDSFVLLAQGNPEHTVRRRFLTTSTIAKERLIEGRIDGDAGLDYWRRAAAAADVTPLRERLKTLSLKPETHSYLARMTDAQFRECFLRLITWETGQPNLEQLQDGLRRSIERVGQKRGISSDTISKCVPAIVQRVFDVCTNPTVRSLTKADLNELINEYTTVRVPIDQHVQTQGLLAAILYGQTVANAGTITPTKSPFIGLTAPKATGFAQRLVVRQSISRRLETNLACWLHAGTGFGKTTLARSAALTAGGDWKAVNLRNLPPVQSAEVLRQIADLLGERINAGVIVDDIDHLDDSDLIDSLAVLGFKRV